MDKTFYNNGYIVKSYNINLYKQIENNYNGIGRYTSWPLDDYNDDISVDLKDEANRNWFGYDDKRIFTIPNMDYVKKYVCHCNNLGVETFIMYIQSTCNIITSLETPKSSNFLGYDYSCGELDYSALYDDIWGDGESIEQFINFRSILNDNGLFATYEDMQEYIEIRNMLMIQGVNLEDYYTLYPMRIFLC